MVQWHDEPNDIRLEAHHRRHEDGGEDEISIAGLSMGLVEVVSTDSPYTAAGDYIIVIDASGGVVTVELPAISGASGKRYYIKCIDATNIVTIDANGSETIDGDLTLQLSKYDCLLIVATSSEWSII